jgi:hypothetical protein
MFLTICLSSIFKLAALRFRNERMSLLGNLSIMVGNCCQEKIVWVCLWKSLEINKDGTPTGEARGTSRNIPSYAKASEGYPPVAKSTGALILGDKNDLGMAYAFIHGQSPWSSA